MAETRLHPFLDWLIAQRNMLLALGILLALVAAYFGAQLPLDRSIEHMFAPDDPVLKPYHALQEPFGKHELAIAIYSDPELASEEGLARIGKLAEEIRAIPGIVAAVSLLDPPGASNFSIPGIGAKLREVFAGYTHNEALDAAGIVCMIARPAEGDPPRRETLRQLRVLVSKLPDGALVGEPVLIEEAFDLLEEDGRRLNTWCTLLLMLTIFAFFRQLRWLILPLVVVHMTLSFTRGLLVAFGLQLSMVSSMLSAIVTVVGVATVVHVIVRYRNALEQGHAPREALLQAGRLLTGPVTFACLTDAAGFAALMISSVGPVHDFGLMMAIGSSLVLVSVALAVPGIVLLGSKASPIHPPANETALARFLQWLLHKAHHHTKLFTGVTVGACVFAAWGSTRLERETDFTRNFRANSSIVESYQFFENRFGGAGVWDILLPTPNPLDKAYVAKVLELQQRLLTEVPHLRKAISLASAIDASRPMPLRIAIFTMREKMPEFVAAIYQPEEGQGDGQLRILLRSPERLGAEEKSRMIQETRRIAREAFPTAEVTGYYVLLNELIESLLRDQWITFGVAAVAILLMMFVAFRSFGLALATLVPNALPVLFLFGGMGWLNVRVNMGAAMIAAVSLGLSVDGSIHYVMSYQRERRNGATPPDALRSVQATVGRAAVFATLALVVGFATLCYSDFVPTVYFGTLVSLSMIGGLMGNLLVLPLLIQWLDRSLQSNSNPVK
jgi:predicted RND superfamily exporter protein